MSKPKDQNEAAGVASELTQMLELKPCPFCGETPELTKHYKHAMWCIIHRCKVIGPLAFDFTENPHRTVAIWNTRATNK